MAGTDTRVKPYGSPPIVVTPWPLRWAEQMHYLYLPVSMPELGLEIPPALHFLYDMIERVADAEDPNIERYIYVTAKRRFAVPDNPINRPGWHADGFGSDDVNYIWSDRWPTVFAEQEFRDISTDHVRSIEQFEEQLDPSKIVTYPDETLLRLDASVVHAAPTIPPPGGERSFLKISVSDKRYNLRGNSHNFGFDYDWEMHSRAEIRNDPAYAGGDAGPQ